MLFKWFSSLFAGLFVLVATDQMNDPRRGQPDRDKDRDELGQSGTQTTNRVSLSTFTT